MNAIETERYEPSLSLAFAIAALFKRPIEAIFRVRKQTDPTLRGKTDQFILKF